MIAKEVTVNNDIGLYARAATKFIQVANEFKSTVLIERDEHKVNAKSLLGVLSMGIVSGTSVTIIAEGVDEARAVDALCGLIEADFAE